MLYINGEWVETENLVKVLNPATGEVLKTVSTGGKEETKVAIESAKEAFKSWRFSTGDERSVFLEKAASIMKDRAKELAQIVTSENGKSLADAEKEVYGAINYVKWYAEEAKRIYGDTIPASSPDKHTLVIRQPVGVVAAITPWNFPLSMITRKIAPAIAAGCTVVLKPALVTPLSAIEIYKCFHEAGLPQGVVNLVIGPAEEIGKELTGSTDVRKLTFTGSTAIGKKLMRDSASTVKKVSMELGGHAPYIVFEDADLEKAVAGVLSSKFTNSGQTCISTNRIYVEESIVEEFGELLAGKASQLVVGDGKDHNVSVGPLINQSSLEKVADQVEDAIKHEGKVLCGGKQVQIGNGKGYFYEPTVIQYANEKMKIATEETFGPVAPIFTFKTEQEAIEKANNSEYGLAAYCFTKDLGRGLRVLEQLDYGIIGINDAAPITTQAPFGGTKESGMGKEGGKYGLSEYLEEKYVSISKS